MQLELINFTYSIHWSQLDTMASANIQYNTTTDRNENITDSPGNCFCDDVTCMTSLQEMSNSNIIDVFFLKKPRPSFNVSLIYLVIAATSQNTDNSMQDQEKYSSLDDILMSQEYLCDLHTHLLGMGNTGFWIDSIIDKPQILPAHLDFCQGPELRKRIFPLIWSEKQCAFINKEQAAELFDLLIEKNFPKCDDFCATLVEHFQRCDPDLIQIFKKMTIENERLLKQLKHYDLSFGNVDSTEKTRNNEGPIKHKILGNFTYDVVLTLDDLGKALGVTTPCNVKSYDLIQSKVEEKLGLHTYQKSTEQPSRSVFRRWIIFNARNQIFEVVKGITVEKLRQLITVDANKSEQACALARAHIRNAFSMCNPDGTDPRLIDFDRFHGSFTPEFYPRRFSLKDSLYSQRLDILAALLVYILRRYQTCLPPVRYCELSIGVGDICRPWILDVLCSFPPRESITMETIQRRKTSFRSIIENGGFSHLRNACPLDDELSLPCTPNVTYKFLAGFSRQTVKAHRLKDQSEAIQLLNDSPDVAIHYMLSAIVQSEEDERLASNNSNSKQPPESPIGVEVTIKRN